MKQVLEKIQRLKGALKTAMVTKEQLLHKECLPYLYRALVLSQGQFCHPGDIALPVEEDKCFSLLGHRGHRYC